MLTTNPIFMLLALTLAPTAFGQASMPSTDDARDLRLELNGSAITVRGDGEYFCVVRAAKQRSFMGRSSVGKPEAGARATSLAVEQTGAAAEDIKTVRCGTAYGPLSPRPLGDAEPAKVLEIGTSRVESVCKSSSPSESFIVGSARGLEAELVAGLLCEASVDGAAHGCSKPRCKGTGPGFSLDAAGWWASCVLGKPSCLPF